MMDLKGWAVGCLLRLYLRKSTMLYHWKSWIFMMTNFVASGDCHNNNTCSAYDNKVGMVTTLGFRQGSFCVALSQSEAVMPSFIGWAHTQIDPCFSEGVCSVTCKQVQLELLLHWVHPGNTCFFCIIVLSDPQVLMSLCIAQQQCVIMMLNRAQSQNKEVWLFLC